MEKKIICRVLTGPTASGKSELAMRLAREEGWDILCMDSMQIYRRMDIGTAKPSIKERMMVRHYLLDLCNPEDSFSVSGYVEKALETIHMLHNINRDFLFVGGTGLYLEALMKPFGMGSVPANESLRRELHQLVFRPGGREELDRILRESDPETADKLPMNDIRRRIRAIEVFRATGIPFSRQENRPDETPFSWIVVSTLTERRKLYEQINRRTDRMIESGLANEVRNLLADGVPEDAQSMQAIGYKEMIPYLRGECTLEKAADDIRTGSRHYAKRQMTYLKRLDQIQYVETGTDQTYDRIRKILKGGSS